MGDDARGRRVESVETGHGGFAGALGIGVGLEDDFVEDPDCVADALEEEHAHGIDVEIEGPDDGIVRVEGDGLDVGRRSKA